MARLPTRPLATLRLGAVKEHAVGIGRTFAAAQIQGMANRAPVVGAVVDQMEEDFLARHRPLLPVRKHKAYIAGKLLWGNPRQVIGGPRIAGSQALRKYVQIRNDLGIGCGMRRLLAQKAGFEQLFDDDHMVELLAHECKRWRGLVLASKSAKAAKVRSSAHTL